MGEEKDLLAGLVLELRRGTLILSVLSQMAEAKYGYALVQSLEEKGVEIDPTRWYRAWRKREWRLTRIPCILCFGGWRSRGFSRAAGIREAPSRANITREPLMEMRFMRS